MKDLGNKANHSRPTRCVLVQPEMDNRHIFRSSGGDFQGIRVFRSDAVSQRVGKGRGAVLGRPDLIVAMIPPGYPSARLLPSRLPFHPAGSV